MSLEHGFPWSYGSWDFKGYSVAGQTTSLVFNEAKICFDIGQGLPFHIASKLFCLTHLHGDHGSGIAYLLSQRGLFSLPQANIMLPAYAIATIERILAEWRSLEGFRYDYQLIPVEDGTTYDFSDQWLVKAFATTHRVPSFGYIVYEKKKKLKKEFLNQDKQLIIDAKSRGEKIEEDVLEPCIAFTGDTQIEFIKSHPDVLKAKLLFMECTYLDERKTVEAAREWGHIHLDEIIENAEAFENEHISFIHLSARYSTKQARDILNNKLPASLQGKVSLYPRPM